MQYQVPQFIDTEDKIAGPFTIRQFIYISVAGLGVFLLYFILQTFIWLIFAIVVIGAAMAFSFAKPNGRKLSVFVRDAFNFYWQPQLYLWQPENPELTKTSENLQERTSGGFDIEKIVSGLSLKNAWQYVQTGSTTDHPAPPHAQQERYQVFRKMTGELRSAKRVDYSG